MKTERDLFQEHYKTNRDYKFYIKHEMTEKQVFEFKDGKYVVECVNDGWKIWQASANRDGYKLVPVDTLDECLSWASIAMWDSPSEERDIEITYHVEIIEAMIGDFK